MPFLNKTGNSIGTTESTVYTVPATKSSILLELDICNISQTGIAVDVSYYDSDGGYAVNLVKNLPIPVGSTVAAISGQKIVMNENDEIRVTSNAASSVDVIVSLLEDV